MTYGVLADSREVFGGPLTQITLLATQQTKEKNPTLFKAVANALDESIRVANADKRAAAILWKKAQNAPESALNAQSLAKGLVALQPDLLLVVAYFASIAVTSTSIIIYGQASWGTFSSVDAGIGASPNASLRHFSAS